MIKLVLNSALLRMALVLVIFASCKSNGGDDDPTVTPPTLTAVEQATKDMTANGGKWNPAALSDWVTVEGVNVTDLFKDFTITFTATGYTTTGTSPVWPRTDTWKFKDNTAKSFIRTVDGKEVAIEVSEKKMKITLTWDQTTFPGRTSSIKGRHEFVLVQ